MRNLDASNVMEESLMADNGPNVVRVCSKSDVAPGAVKAFAVGSNMLAVYNIDGTFYVTDDECTHAAASLADGLLEGDVIECCMHMGSFHVPTGNVVAPPCEVPLRTYQVRLRGDDIFADLGRNAAGEPQ
jgi:nitrite reductase/ring-hydroxylating ferredoxin subunit